MTKQNKLLLKKLLKEYKDQKSLLKQMYMYYGDISKEYGPFNIDSIRYALNKNWKNLRLHGNKNIQGLATVQVELYKIKDSNNTVFAIIGDKDALKKILELLSLYTLDDNTYTTKNFMAYAFLNKAGVMMFKVR